MASPLFHDVPIPCSCSADKSLPVQTLTLLTDSGNSSLFFLLLPKQGGQKEE